MRPLSSLLAAPLLTKMYTSTYICTPARIGLESRPRRPRRRGESADESTGNVAALVRRAAFVDLADQRRPHKASFSAAAPDVVRRAGRAAGLTSSPGVKICSSRSGVSVATFVVVTGRRRRGLGVSAVLAMIKLNESKLCMMNGGGDGGRGEDWW